MNWLFSLSRYYVFYVALLFLMDFLYSFTFSVGSSWIFTSQFALLRSDQVFVGSVVKSTSMIMSNKD